MDDRCEEEICTHDGSKMHATKVQSLSSVDPGILATADFVGIDEGQFFPDLEGKVREWVAKGKHVAVAGLSGDFRARPFDNVMALIPLANDVQHKKALCKECGEPAIFSRRSVPSEERFLAGGNASYQAVCRKHFDFKNDI